MNIFIICCMFFFLESFQMIPAFGKEGKDEESYGTLKVRLKQRWLFERLKMLYKF